MDSGMDSLMQLLSLGQQQAIQSIPLVADREAIMEWQKSQLPPEPTPVPFYPSERHVKYNWAPEKTLNTQTIAEIAAARKRAEANNILPPELGNYLLPMAMVEGEGRKLGILENSGGYYASRKMLKALEQMGLEEGKDYISYRDGGDKFIQPIEGSPAMAAVILGHKASLKGIEGDPEKAIKAYNVGTSKHWEKIQSAMKLLEHPLNSKLRTHFQREYDRAR